MTQHNRCFLPNGTHRTYTEPNNTTLKLLVLREEKEANRWRDKFTKKIAQSNHQTKTGGRRIELGSHKEHPEVVNDDDD
ncbi:hypothetical protein Tco_0528914 [Tanacetum coccineum]